MGIPHEPGAPRQTGGLISRPAPGATRKKRVTPKRRKEIEKKVAEFTKSRPNPRATATAPKPKPKEGAAQAAARARRVRGTYAAKTDRPGTRSGLGGSRAPARPDDRATRPTARPRNDEFWSAVNPEADVIAEIASILGEENRIQWGITNALQRGREIDTGDMGDRQFGPTLGAMGRVDLSEWQPPEFGANIEKEYDLRDRLATLGASPEQIKFTDTPLGYIGQDLARTAHGVGAGVWNLGAATWYDLTHQTGKVFGADEGSHLAAEITKMLEAQNEFIQHPIRAWEESPTATILGALGLGAGGAGAATRVGSLGRIARGADPLAEAYGRGASLAAMGRTPNARAIAAILGRGPDPGFKTIGQMKSGRQIPDPDAEIPDDLDVAIAQILDQDVPEVAMVDEFIDVTEPYSRNSLWRAGQKLVGQGHRPGTKPQWRVDDAQRFHQLFEGTHPSLQKKRPKDVEEAALMEGIDPEEVTPESAQRFTVNLRSYMEGLGTAGKDALKAYDALSRFLILFSTGSYLRNAPANYLFNAIAEGLATPFNTGKTAAAFFGPNRMSQESRQGVMRAMQQGSIKSFADPVFENAWYNLPNRLAAQGFSYVTDRPQRAQAFIHEAGRRGANSPEALERLLNDPEFRSLRNETFTGANRNMVDYGNIGRGEDLARLAVMFYPWLKGSLIWEGRFLKEHPIWAATMGQAGVQGSDDILSDLGLGPSFTQDVFKVGERDGMPTVRNPAAFNPFTTGPDLFQTALSATGPIPRAFRPSEYLSPLAQSGLTALTGYDPFTQSQVPGDQSMYDIFADQLKSSISLSRLFDRYGMRFEIPGTNIGLGSDESTAGPETLYPVSETGTGRDFWEEFFQGPFAPREQNPEKRRALYEGEQTDLATGEKKGTVPAHFLRRKRILQMRELQKRDPNAVRGVLDEKGNWTRLYRGAWKRYASLRGRYAKAGVKLSESSSTPEKDVVENLKKRVFILRDMLEEMSIGFPFDTEGKDEEMLRRYIRRAEYLIYGRVLNKILDEDSKYPDRYNRIVGDAG